ncbi:MAG: glutamate-1-semialdehyde 2,1-aminomutase [Fibrobacteres bacterium]|nr:glutamate-1-semialdehyde 2,1-aminomutase [Fibrobacterota bacterium]
MNNNELFENAKKIFPGGVNSPVRSFRSVESIPRFIDSGKGPVITDTEGNNYIDYVLSWGPLLLGHAHESVVKAASLAIEKGMSFGAPTDLENQLGIMVQKFFPSMELMRFVNSGTEACMGAIRVARATTNRDNIIKFSGCYHGHADYLLVSAGSGVSTLGLPDSPGVPQSFTAHTFVSPYNDIDAIKKLMASKGSTVAAIIVEPVAGNMGFMPPRPGFLETLRQLCTEYDSILIFDEVMTGFRVAKGGAQQLYGIKPDLTCLGKVIGGGMPVGAYGGCKDLMSLVAPLGKVYQAGTLSGNPVAMAAGLATLKTIDDSNAFEKAETHQIGLVAALNDLGKKRDIAWTVSGLGTMFGIRFQQGEAYSYEDLKKCDSAKYGKFFRAALANGVYFAPSAFESAFTSSVHSENELNTVLSSIERIISTF